MKIGATGQPKLRSFSVCCTFLSLVFRSRSLPIIKNATIVTFQGFTVCVRAVSGIEFLCYA
jgi:hypothetical protein